jgi:hypothetical protein
VLTGRTSEANAAVVDRIGRMSRDVIIDLNGYSPCKDYLELKKKQSSESQAGVFDDKVTAEAHSGNILRGSFSNMNLSADVNDDERHVRSRRTRRSLRACPSPRVSQNTGENQ